MNKEDLFWCKTTSLSLSEDLLAAESNNNNNNNNNNKSLPPTKKKKKKDQGHCRVPLAQMFT